jgi:hypothetical protein
MNAMKAAPAPLRTPETTGKTPATTIRLNDADRVAALRLARKIGEPGNLSAAMRYALRQVAGEMKLAGTKPSER